MKRILLSLLAGLFLITLLVGCGTDASDPGATSDPGTDATSAATDPAGGDDPETSQPNQNETVTLKVWGSQDQQPSLGAMIDAFKAANPDVTYDISLGVVGENDAKTKYLEDPEAAADVFCFANDQLRDLLAADALYEVTRNKDEIVNRNVPGAVEAASMDGVLYAYPMTADNGYFMYYDKSVFSEDDMKSLDKMMEVANAKDKKIYMDVANGWYIASFFLGAGGNLSLGPDGKQVCDFNNATGLAVAEGIMKFTKDPSFVTGDDAVFSSGIGGSIAAGVSGTWNAGTVAENMGDNYAACKLPTFTVDGKQVQMASFGGYKLVGVNSLTKDPTHAMDLADFLTNEENQIKRFTALQLGPSNINASKDPAVAADVALSGLAQQSEFALPQNEVTGMYWDPAKALGTAIVNGDESVSLQQRLDDMVSQIQA